MTRPLPPWFDDAKFGIFIHWTPASIPAFAPVGPSPFALAEEHGWAYAVANSPYAEWYQNSLAIEGSPVAEHHAVHHTDESYDDFVASFVAGHDGWRPQDWARLFAAAGARYVVLVTKHHDGFTLWPSATPNPNPNREGWAARRDLVGDLAEAVRAEGMRFGTYYSGGLDWTFGGLPITDAASMIAAIPQDEAYLAYADAHWRELIDRYAPDLLWNDIGYPAAGDLAALQDHYYARVPDGVVNDRFRWAAPEAEVHADFVTPEYSTVAPPGGRKWESTRGFGGSFGYNRDESPDDLLDVAELVRMLVDVTARGGNLLLNVGPTGEGRVPWAQAERLLGLGGWLATNGAAVFGTRPWTAAPTDDPPPDDRRDAGSEVAGDATGDVTEDGLDVRHTAGTGDDGAARYAIVLGTPTGRRVDLPVPEVPTDATVVTRVGHDGPLAWRATAPGRVEVDLGDDPSPTAFGPAFVLRFALPVAPPVALPVAN